MARRLGTLGGDARGLGRRARTARRSATLARRRPGSTPLRPPRPDRARASARALLDLAKSLRPDGFGLWVFETNAGARRFYERHGLVEVERTDGSDNEERAPDVRMAWPDPASLAGLRGRIDEIDDQLARPARRAGRLTARVQQVKEVPATPAATRTARPRSSRGWPGTPRSWRGAAPPDHAPGDHREPRRREIGPETAAAPPEATRHHAAPRPRESPHHPAPHHPAPHQEDLMTDAPLPDDVRALLAKPNPAVITTLRPDGQPVSVATWYLFEDDGRILVNMDEGRKRLAYLRETPGSR